MLHYIIIKPRRRATRMPMRNPPIRRAPIEADSAQESCSLVMLIGMIEDLILLLLLEEAKTVLVAEGLVAAADLVVGHMANVPHWGF